MCLTHLDQTLKNSARLRLKKNVMISHICAVMTESDAGRTIMKPFRGNKTFLPSKLCAVCGREMTWRKAWAKNWESVKYCSDACRTKRLPKPKP
jgi:hypothetical protein